MAENEKSHPQNSANPPGADHKVLCRGAKTLFPHFSLQRVQARGRERGAECSSPSIRDRAPSYDS